MQQQINILMSDLMIFCDYPIICTMIARNQFNSHGGTRRLFQIRHFWVDSNVTGAVAQRMQHVESLSAWDAVRRHWRTYQVQSLSAKTQSRWCVCVCVTDWQAAAATFCSSQYMKSCPRACLYMSNIIQQKSEKLLLNQAWSVIIWDFNAMDGSIFWLLTFKSLQSVLHRDKEPPHLSV